MALGKLSESLIGIVKKITLASFVDEKLVREIVKELQKALLSADVNVKLVFELSKKIEERALKEKPLPGLSMREHVLKILYEELVSLLGKKQEFSLPRRARIMLIGLQGSGKTTTVGKLAKFYSKRGLRVLVIGTDTYRPAAFEQLKQLAEEGNFALHGSETEKNAAEILKGGLSEARRSDIVILDTAGRHSTEEELFREMKELASIFAPDEKILVLDANLGQTAGKQAKAFHDAIGITGVIITKLDSSAKGGGALSAVAETGVKIKFIATGEKLDAFEVFNADRFISRLLGMGDLRTLLEKAKEEISEEKAEKILKSGKITMNDLREQIKSIMKLGSLGSILKMIPGFSMFANKEVSELTEVKMKKFLFIIDSMTKQEREKPEIISGSRIQRIARGSGTSKEEVKELLKYFKNMQSAFKKLKKARRGMLPFKGLEKLGL